MPETIEELVVRVTPEGMEKTTEELNEQEQAFDEMAETAADKSEQLEEFSERWQGAMAGIIAALSIGVAGLARRIPVVGELMAGLNSILNAFGFQLDKVLRPVLQPVTQLFFDLSNAIFKADGGLSALLAAFATFASLAAGAVVAALVGLNPAILGIAAAFAVVTGAVAALTAAWKTNFLGIRTKVFGVIDVLKDLWSLLKTVGGWLVSGLAGALDWLVRAFTDPEWAATQFWNLLTDIGSWATTAIGGAFDWVENALLGPKGVLTDMWNLLTDIGSWATTAIGGAFDWVENALLGPKGVLTDMWNLLTDIGAWATTAIAGAFDWLERAVDDVADIVEDILDDLRTIANNVWATVIDITMQLPDPPSGPIIPGSTGPRPIPGGPFGPSAASGGHVTEGGWARVHEGEDIVPAEIASGGQGGDGLAEQVTRLVRTMQATEQKTTVTLDGRTIAETLQPLIGEGAVNAGATQRTR